jgi:ABC-type transport system involved in multi-copper enzyme maturation permease subunit
MSSGDCSQQDFAARPEVGSSSRNAGQLELPSPWRLLLMVGWNLGESLGLPLAAYLLAAALSGRVAGMLAATAAVWLTAAGRRLATGSVPGLLLISALVLSLQTALVVATGSGLVFLLQFPLANLALCLLFARTAPTCRPLIRELAAEVAQLRLPSRPVPGLDRFFRGATWLWSGIFAGSAVALAALMAIEPYALVILLAAIITVAGTAAGALISALWFVRVRRRLGLRLRFGPV